MGNTLGIQGLYIDTSNEFVMTDQIPVLYGREIPINSKENSVKFELRAGKMLVDNDDNIFFLQLMY